MRHRIASSAISAHDVCLFCAFRPAFEAATRSAKPHRAIRNYKTSAITSSPASATAAKEQDGDEDAPPMLKQNANLANAFPSKRQSATPSISIPPTAGTSRLLNTAEDNSFQNRNKRIHNTRQRQDGTLSFRNNFDMFSQKNVEQTRGSEEKQNNMKVSRQPFLNERSNQDADRARDRFPRRGQPRHRPPIDRRDDKPKQVSIHRFVPGQGFQQDVEGDVTTQKILHNERNQGSRFSVPSQTGNVRMQQQQRPENPASRVRSIFTDDPNKSDPTESQVNESADVLWYNPLQSAPKNDEISSPVEDNDGVDTMLSPTRTVFHNQTDDIVSHHRRGHHPDRKKPRSLRFEDDEEPDESTTSTRNESRSAQDQIGRAGGRGRQFDYELAEAEEALYGDGRRRKRSKKGQVQKVEVVKPTLKIPEFMSVGQLANALGVQTESFLGKLEEEGFEGARYDHILDSQTSSMLADIYGFEPVVAVEDSSVDLVARPPPEDIANLPPRPPIVTIMGHVDHGKTTILDYLRKSSVVATEHGGITQHIGAFSVTMPGTNRQITFLDTPGHAAFLEMRRRGANVTDIVVLVVAADDSVKPQTIEAIKHAMEAGVQIIVAINKVDKEDANVERVKQDLSRHDVVVEDYGGDYQAIAVSGKTGQGMADLEEAIITLADVHDFRAENDGPAEGTIIESKVTAAGRVATILVRRGTLRTGDFMVAGTTWGRVRTLRDDNGNLVTEAPPGTPVQVDGWRGSDPTAGLEVLQAENEEQAKKAVDFRLEREESMRITTSMAAINEARSEEADARAKVLAWEAEQEWARRSHGRRPKDNTGWVEPETSSGPKQVHFIVKADVAGSVEAVVASVSAVGNQEIVANVVHSGTGQVTEFDIQMLATTGEKSYIISFNQPIDGSMYRLAETAGLQILDHNIIYKVTDVVKEKLSEELPPLITQKVLGEAEIGQIFDVTIKKNKVKIAGCKVTNGTISRSNKIRVQRAGDVVYTGTLHSLKNVKKDVTEMRKGTECGMGFENWEDFQEGDQIQCFEEHEEKRTLY